MNLSLAEQFVLLAHKPNGGRVLAADFAGAAELGDLLLWQRVQLSGGKASIVDPTPTGLPWVDGTLSTFQTYAGSRNKPVSVNKYILGRAPIRAGGGSALATHRSFLVNRGFAQCRRKLVLKRYYPDPHVWNGALAELRAFARNELGQDHRLLLLAAMTHATALDRSLPLTDPERKQIKMIGKNTEFGATVRAIVVSASSAS